MQELSSYQKTFLDMVNNHIKFYPEYSFQLYFDNTKQPLIGKSKKIITAKFTNSSKVLKRIFTEGSLGLGESYCQGLINVADKDYKEFLFIFVRAAMDKKMLLSLPLITKLKVLKARFSGSFFTKENQHQNINAHYSLTEWFDNDDDSNKFYLYWLNSKYIQYTCAKWDKDTKNLEDAQRNKFEFYCKRLGINKNSKGKTLLDLGCGWGGFMFYVAEKYGLICKGLTLSTAQAKYIKQEAKRRKANVTVDNINVHDMYGKYDYIASIGLLEHINDYNDLFKKTSLHLNKNGSVLFHAIHNNGLFYKPDSFLLKYVFPGGSTPNIKTTVKTLKKYFKHVERNDLPYLSYPKTLTAWYTTFCKNEDKIRKLLKENGKVKDIDFAIRIFKHYLVLCICGLTINGFVANVLAKNE